MNKHKQHGFTLVEILTVLAIIAILAAILIPVVNKVRMGARDSAGLSNIRQVGVTYLLAAQDNRGVLPGYVIGGATRKNWDRIVNALLTDTAPVNYPSLWSKTLQDPAGIARGEISEDARYHFAPLAALTRGTGNGNGTGAAPKALRPYNRLSAHGHPERQILMADAGVNGPDFDAPWSDLLHGESFSWSGNWNGNVDESRANNPIDPGQNIGGDIRWSEDGTAKFFFLDGHVERRAQAEVLEKNLNPLFP